ncbi:AAA family ATPase [Paenibacillus sp. F411]|uniref:ATP-binding protein n=1 Tax=Paenibacillus sp. F411 TaxID=2820239 RepID=UPI001AAF81ED|nr:ATP-binding protein [Paenibacillus sp. F411]MBO2942777.1 AAA family ATPase [Paenibacillus sp. F411]
MKRITLEDLKLRNFKGFREFVLAANGGDVDAFGDNATGKTTLFDAFIWLLFGKDSSNRSEFEIKELDQAGKVVQHGLEHEVEAVLMVDRRRRTFRKVFTEKWTRKRGAATSEFNGHTTNYFVDGVPVKQNQYKTEVDALISEDIFKLLTSPSYFNEVLKPDARRKVLLEVCGNLTDNEIISSNEQLAPLTEILGERSIDSHKKVIASRRSEINKELEKIPTRIDEVRRSMPDVSDLDEELLQEDIDTLHRRIDAKTAELQHTHSGGELAAKELRLREINTERIEIKHSIQADSVRASNEQSKLLLNLKGEASDLKARISAGQREVEQYQRQISRAEGQANRLREEWHATNALEFLIHEHPHDESCPTCGQALPADQVQAAQDKALADFNLSKSQRLERISSDGKAAAEEVRKLKHSMFDLEESLVELEKQLSLKQVEVSTAEVRLSDLQAAVADPAENSEYQAKQKEAELIGNEIEQLRISTSDAAAKVQAEIRMLRDQVSELEADKVKIMNAAATNKRIAELAEQERRLAAEYEQLEHELFLTEEFTRTKVSLLESKINSQFKYARFRLFEEQLNGGLNDVCKTLYNGVPYDGGLNNAARINVGLDIINTLSEHYGFSAPIFIDNAESVTQLIQTDAQIIRLVVSEEDKQLRVVIHNKMKEAI